MSERQAAVEQWTALDGGNKMNIKNPILPGFHPDPSIIRVEDDYYIATSTFEWFPGIQLRHSEDLKNWKNIGYALTRTSQIDLKGCDISGGVFAPCLTYHNGTYYLMYTNVRTHWYAYMDCHNYLITTKDIYGEWSDPIYIHSAGFDPSLFHDDGRKWVTSVLRRYRADENGGTMAGIVIQEFDEKTGSLVGELHHIYNGSGKITTPEGPHIYKKDGWYYLLAAEGGTEYGHAATLARSKNILGPYELCPHNPILTSRDDLSLELQKAGHGDLVETPSGEWYMVHLCSRPLPPFRRCILGRETAIQKVVWDSEGWLQLEDGSHSPKVEVEIPNMVEGQATPKSKKYLFDSDKLDFDFQSLRIPLDESMMSLTERRGYLRLIGKDSPNSRFEQSMVVRRQESFHFTAETCVEFDPTSERQMAGLIYIYDTDDFCYLRVTCNYHGKRILDVLTLEHGNPTYSPVKGIEIGDHRQIYLKLTVKKDVGVFSYSFDAVDWNEIGHKVDASKLSDEHCKEGAYTGAMVGMCCSDMLYRKAYADFGYFEYVAEDE
ncbi:glycoside hydrolase family 43 protein [Neobacillus drentensis]|uniref:glycoside hydrolase family 43 protein n=1 Tax=Neobacillus drentensis TaxID=220684 RepID=UPI0030019F12